MTLLLEKRNSFEWGTETGLVLPEHCTTSYVIIFDEATSALDIGTEDAVMRKWTVES